MGGSAPASKSFGSSSAPQSPTPSWGGGAGGLAQTGQDLGNPSLFASSQPTPSDQTGNTQNQNMITALNNSPESQYWLSQGYGVGSQPFSQYANNTNLMASMVNPVMMPNGQIFGGVPGQFNPAGSPLPSMGGGQGGYAPGGGWVGPGAPMPSAEDMWGTYAKSGLLTAKPGDKDQFQYGSPYLYNQDGSSKGLNEEGLAQAIAASNLLKGIT